MYISATAGPRMKTKKRSERMLGRKAGSKEHLKGPGCPASAFLVV